jgi:hypothetical protein
MAASSRNPLPAVLVAGILLPALLASACSSSSSGVGYLAQSVAVGDLDGDGRLDVLTAIAASPSTASLLSARIQVPAAPGTFANPVQSPTGADPVDLAVGDLDGDGLPDVAVANPTAAADGSHAVDVQFQIPGTPGAFTAPLSLPLGALTPRRLVLADLNADGRLDIAVAAAGTDDVQVLFQQAPGSFAAPVGFPVAGEPTAVAAGGITGDGGVDLVVTTASGNLSVLLHGSIPGTFLPPASYAAGTSPAAVQIADMNGDGRPDVLVADYDGTLEVFLQAPAGDGTLLPPARHDTLDYGSCSIAIGDIDGDGRPDAVVANAGPPGFPGSVAVFFQDHAVPGQLAPPVLYRGYWGPLSVALGDLNDDGLVDMVVADGSPYVRFQSTVTPGLFLPPVWLKF